jgi:hypothetical protein
MFRRKKWKYLILTIVPFLSCRHTSFARMPYCYFLQMFRRKKWKYLILDEAHMIKNWKSQRWQTLLRFNSKRRLLITGTPLQVRHRCRCRTGCFAVLASMLYAARAGLCTLFTACNFVALNAPWSHTVCYHSCILVQ